MAGRQISGAILASIFLILTVVFAAWPAAAQDTRGTWSLQWENDIFGGTDKDYTNGLRASYLSDLHPSTGVTGWVARTLMGADNEDPIRYGLAAGQSIYTPENLQATQPLPNQHPYAAWLYGEYAVLVQKPNQLDRMTFQAGIVGEGAGGEWVQNNVHSLINDQEAKGWGNQIANEPGFNISYDRRWRALAEFESIGLGFDVTPSAGLTVGNVNTQASAGLMLRMGSDLADDFGPPRIRPSLAGSAFFTPRDSFSWYLFAGVEGSAVAHNIFRDGSLFRDDDPDVTSNHLIGDMQAGLVFQIADVQVGYTYVVRTKEFEEQDDGPQFGAVTISTKF